MAGIMHNPKTDLSGSCAWYSLVSPRRWSFFAMILPYMEQQPVYNALNFQVAAVNPFGPVHGGLINSSGLTPLVSAYVCPTDLPAERLSVPGESNNGFSQSSYAVNVGTWNTIAYWYGCPNPNYPGRIEYPGNGPFDASTSYRESQIRDGLSNTVFVGEYSKFLNDPSTWQNSWTVYGFFGAGPISARGQSAATLLPRINAPFLQSDFSDLPEGSEDDSDYRAWTLDPARYKEYGNFGFHSLHPGGAHMLLGDGSVRFLKQTTAQQIHMALGTRAASEAISADAY